MENVHLVDEDLYTGYNFNNSQEAFGMPLKKSFQSQSSMATASGSSTSLSLARPMTAIRGAGYSASKKALRTTFNSSVETRERVKIQQIERKIRLCLKESIVASSSGKLEDGLKQAIEAAGHERILNKQKMLREPDLLPKIDITFGVLINLAIQYEKNRRFPEAVKAYEYLIKCPKLPNPERFKLNLANIFLKQKKYPKAIKLYTMALDQIGSGYNYIKAKIFKNLGKAHLKMGNFEEGIVAYEHAMDLQPNYSTGLNLILCAYFVKDKDQMKTFFEQLACISIPFYNEVRKTEDHGDDPSLMLQSDEIRNDSLSKWMKEQHESIVKAIIKASTVIAPFIEEDCASGYDWCIEQLKTSIYCEVIYDLEIKKGMLAIKSQDYDQAIEIFKKLAHLEGRIGSISSTNLSFIYYYMNDIQKSVKYADVACKADHYNAQAMVNKGNCLFRLGNIGAAINNYREALLVESSCIEALYNLGLLSKKIGDLDLPLDCFFKLFTMFRNQPFILYQISSTYECIGDNGQAMEWYQGLTTLLPTEPEILLKVGNYYAKDGDSNGALQYVNDSYRCFPSNLGTLEWLANYFLKMGMFEKAQEYIQKAIQIEPHNEQWRLLYASCLKHCGHYQDSLEQFRQIRKDFPNSLPCLKELVKFAPELLPEEYDECQMELKRQEMRMIKFEQSLDRLSISSGMVPMGFEDILPCGLPSYRAKNEIDFDYEDISEDLLPE